MTANAKMTEADVQALCDSLVANKPSLTEMKIEIYDVSDKEMDKITSAMKRNNFLQKVHVGGGILTAATALSLNDAFVPHPKLNEVSFFDVKLVEFIAIALAFCQNEHLSRLSFKECIFTETVMENLRFLLKKNALESLEIVDTTLGDHLSLDLSGGLGCNRSLRELTLKDTCVTRNTLRDIPRMMRLNQEIVSIDIECSESPHASSTSDAHNISSSRLLVPLLIIQAAERHKSLRRLCLFSGDFEEVIVEAVGNMLQNTPSLQVLDLSNAFLGSVGIHPIATALKCADNKLVELDLSWNALADDGATALVEVLRLNQRLKSLSLRYNCFGDIVSSVFATALKENSTLECIRLDGNNLGPHFTITIFNALRTNNTLKHISLLDNPIENNGVANICDVLKNNTTLERIEIEGFGEQGMDPKRTNASPPDSPVTIGSSDNLHYASKKSPVYVFKASLSPGCTIATTSVYSNDDDDGGSVEVERNDETNASTPFDESASQGARMQQDTTPMSLKRDTFATPLQEIPGEPAQETKKISVRKYSKMRPSSSFQVGPLTPKGGGNSLLSSATKLSPPPPLSPTSTSTSESKSSTESANHFGRAPIEVRSSPRSMRKCRLERTIRDRKVESPLLKEQAAAMRKKRLESAMRNRETQRASDSAPLEDKTLRPHTAHAHPSLSPKRLNLSSQISPISMTSPTPKRTNESPRVTARAPVRLDVDSPVTIGSSDNIHHATRKSPVYVVRAPLSPGSTIDTTSVYSGDDDDDGSVEMGRNDETNASAPYDERASQGARIQQDTTPTSVNLDTCSPPSMSKEVSPKPSSSHVGSLTPIVGRNSLSFSSPKLSPPPPLSPKANSNESRSSTKSANYSGRGLVEARSSPREMRKMRLDYTIRDRKTTSPSDKEKAARSSCEETVMPQLTSSTRSQKGAPIVIDNQSHTTGEKITALSSPCSQSSHGSDLMEGILSSSDSETSKEGPMPPPFKKITRVEHSRRIVCDSSISDARKNKAERNEGAAQPTSISSCLSGLIKQVEEADCQFFNPIPAQKKKRTKNASKDLRRSQAYEAHLSDDDCLPPPLLAHHSMTIETNVGEC